jgi:hypothetical protein
VTATDAAAALENRDDVATELRYFDHDVRESAGRIHDAVEIGAGAKNPCGDQRRDAHTFH